MGFFDKIINFFQERLSNLTGEKKQRLILVCTAIFVVLLTFSVIISFIGSGKDKVPEVFDRTRFDIAIPAEELFLPDEPDFLPEVLLEREKRSSWTEQDAGEFWQDPVRFGEEQWRNKIEAAIDEFLERVP
ncbi:MAG: hypothetical protein LBI12_05475 [Treponema sp.]|jgi:hypothetical protein|nr:hypothetical protein [Treponema sp.]